MTLSLPKYGCNHYQRHFIVILIAFFIIHLFIKHFTTLIRWNTVNHSIHSSLHTICWDHHLFYFRQGCWDFPGRPLQYHPPTLWKSRRYDHPMLIRPPNLINAKEYSLSIHMVAVICGFQVPKSSKHLRSWN